MKAGSGTMFGALAAGVGIVAFAVGSHWLVGMNVAGRWAAWLNFAQHFGFNAFMAFVFGRTLRAGRVPLVTRLAALVHERMTPVLAAYTRQVTVAWTLFFLACAVLSALLFAFAPIDRWSIFANILPVPLVALMFVAEYEVRKRVLPPEDIVGILETFRAFRAGWKS